MGTRRAEWQRNFNLGNGGRTEADGWKSEEAAQEAAQTCEPKVISFKEIQSDSLPL